MASTTFARPAEPDEKQQDQAFLPEAGAILVIRQKGLFAAQL